MQPEVVMLQLNYLIPLILCDSDCSETSQKIALKDWFFFLSVPLLIVFLEKFVFN